MDSVDEDNLCRFGTPLEPLEQDEIPSKKPIAIEDQIVTDENGRRRFHGAFTGGFSAGFWNTVGSLEGWQPKTFKSSRSEKAEKLQPQAPTDFMDDEDLGEFGIAPQRIQAKEDFSTNDASSSRKRRIAAQEYGPIPGIPVLHQLLQPAKEKVAIRLLRQMGWKPGQGIGARQTRKEKIKSRERNKREEYVVKVYGCALGPDAAQSSNRSDNESTDVDEDSDDEITFAPEDFETITFGVKDNACGLGYSGLSRTFGVDESSSKGALSFLAPKNIKKIPMKGQAFGVGALEEDDEDIYAADDITKYDFTMGDKKNDTEDHKAKSFQDRSVLEGFTEAKASERQVTLHRVELKSNFKPRNWLQRKTRFEPLPEDKVPTEDLFKKRGLGRHDLNPDERANLFADRKTNVPVSKEEQREQQRKRDDRTKQLMEMISSKAGGFIKGGLILNNGTEVTNTESLNIDESALKENEEVLTKAKEKTKTLGDAITGFQPFIGDQDKQSRYDEFIAANVEGEDEIKAFLNKIQPLHLSDWDREMEMKEFMQAKKIYKPLNGVMADRFVPKSNEVESGPSKPIEADEKVKIIVKRTKKTWKPCSLMCKRFNVPEPGSGVAPELEPRNKKTFSVFDYIEGSVNSKKDFVTPVIIPKHMERPKAIIKQPDYAEHSIKSAPAIPKEIHPTLQHPIIKSQPAIPLTIPTPRSSTTNKTELEIRVAETKDTHPSEKKDLFKSIFDSSSDEEDSSDKTDGNASPSPIVVPVDVFTTLTKPSAPINLLRNNSPPRGIFAALFSNPPKETKPHSSKQDPVHTPDKPVECTTPDVIPEDDGTYGPKLPENFIQRQPPELSKDDIDKKISALLVGNSSKLKKIEEWVEKSHKSSKKKKKKDKKADRHSGHKHKKSKKHKKK